MQQSPFIGQCVRKCMMQVDNAYISTRAMRCYKNIHRAVLQIRLPLINSSQRCWCTPSIATHLSTALPPAAALLPAIASSAIISMVQSCMALLNGHERAAGVGPGLAQQELLGVCVCGVYMFELSLHKLKIENSVQRLSWQPLLL